MKEKAYIATYTGKKFFPFKPNADDIDIKDIAHSLSLLCRFNGHCKEFYSVAQHSVIVSKMLDGTEYAMWGLLHDAGEAYLSDIPKPIKPYIPRFEEIEDTLLQHIIKKFDLRFPMPKEVAQADKDVLDLELASFIYPSTIPNIEKIIPISPKDAERNFLTRFEELSS